jgi:hypothetical protein
MVARGTGGKTKDVDAEVKRVDFSGGAAEIEARSNIDTEKPVDAEAPAPDSDDGGFDLGLAAAAGMGDVAGEHGVQETIPGTDSTKVKFVGMAFDSLDKEDEPKIGEERKFYVVARCVGHSDEASRQDGSIRHSVKMQVFSVQPAE